MVHLKVAILIATLLIIDPTQPDEAADLGNLDFTELFSTDENKYPKLVDLNSVEATKAPEKCSCLPRKECSVNTEGFGLIDIRMGCPDDDHTCCPLDSIIKSNRRGSLTKKPNCDCVARSDCTVNPDGLNLLGLRIDCPNDHEVCCPSDKITKRDEVKNSTNCICVVRNDCDISSDGFGQLGLRIDCSYDNEVCCPPDKIKKAVTEETEVSEITEKTLLPICSCIPTNDCINNIHRDSKLDFRKTDCPNQNESCCPFDQMKNLTTETTTKPPSSNLVGKKCGIRYTKGVNQRIGTRIQNEDDTEAELGEFPWIVGIYTTKTVPILEYMCGGSLIHPEVVVTVAHCLKGGKKLSQHLLVRAGDHDQQTELEIVEHQDREVAEVIKHPSYYRAGNLNDIALLILTTPFILKSHINLICIPPTSTNFDNQKCYAAGWGKDKDGSDGKFKNLLQKVELPIVPKNVCLQQLMKTDDLPARFTIHESLICAGGVKGEDTCKGDGGSPLVCAIPNDPLHYYQAGIVSWGIGCGMENVPALYTNVALFKVWIDEQLKLKGFNTSVYEFE